MKQALLGLLLAATLPVHAAALPQFKAFIAGTKTLAADFTQTVSSKQRQETAHGTMQIQRPGKLRWTYAQPFEQLIVGDGKTLWLYDKELAQVTRRDQAGALGLRSVTTLSFPTMGRADDAQGGAARLVALKSVEGGYPLRGRLRTADAPRPSRRSATDLRALSSTALPSGTVMARAWSCRPGPPSRGASP